MTNLITKRAITAVVALGIAAGATGLAPATAFAATHTHKAKPAVCAKATVGTTKKSGKITWVCEKSGKHYKWVKVAKKSKK